jgi:hypothetical protein
VFQFLVIVQAMSMLKWKFLSNFFADKNYLLSRVASKSHQIFLNIRFFFDNFTARLIFDFRSTISSWAFIHFIWNYEIMFYTATTKSCKIFIEFQPVTMDIYINLKWPINCKNSKIWANFSFLTFLFNFEFLPSIQILEMGILTYPKPQFKSLASIFEPHRWPQSLKLSFINFVIFRKILQKKLNFNCNFLKEGIRYLTFPVDFLKAETIEHEWMKYLG